MQQGWLERLIQETTIRSWWVYLFALLSYGCYEYMSMKQEGVLEGLRQRRVQQIALLGAEMRHHADFLLQLRSHEDPAWIELTLMRCLGVAPADQTKVYFYDASSPAD